MESFLQVLPSFQIHVLQPHRFFFIRYLLRHRLLYHSAKHIASQSKCQRKTNWRPLHPHVRRYRWRKWPSFVAAGKLFQKYKQESVQTSWRGRSSFRLVEICISVLSITVANVLYNPDKEGFLYKLGGKIKGWKRRWIVLTEKVFLSVFHVLKFFVDALLFRRSKRPRAERNHSPQQRSSAQMRRERQKFLLRAV